MRKPTLAVFILVGSACAPLALVAPVAPKTLHTPVAPFDFNKTMRVDYVHSGGPSGETVALDRVVSERAWPGNRTQLIDDTNLGKYFFEVLDRASDRVIYSRGFASIYGEWETTAEVRSRDRMFQESLRLPWPKAPVRIILKKRDQRNTFQEFWATEVDPGSIQESDAIYESIGIVRQMLETGPPSVKVDLLLISEGYSEAELAKFRSDAARLVGALFSLEPFKSRQSDFNVRTLELSGKAVPVEYNIFGLPRYMLTFHDQWLRIRASKAPYDIVAILVNDEQYGGGGIFNQQSTVAAGNPQAAYVFVHELAHNLAGLADEYVGNVTYETGARQTVEPWEPNVTALLDPARLKWRDLVEPGTPLPTPMRFKGKVGAFEGAGYEARGLYRPEAECIMSVKNLVSFCRVCQRAINRIIDLHTQ